MDWEQKLDTFFEEGHWVLAPGRQDEGEYSCYLWEDFKAAETFFRESEEPLYVYSVIDGDDGLYIVKGARYVNRYAYLLSQHEIPLEEELRFTEDNDEEL